MPNPCPGQMQALVNLWIAALIVPNPDYSPIVPLDNRRRGICRLLDLDPEYVESVLGDRRYGERPPGDVNSTVSHLDPVQAYLMLRKRPSKKTRDDQPKPAQEPQAA